MKKPPKDFIANPRSARSDDLVDLREICRALTDFVGVELVGPAPVLNFVVDASVVLQHLGYVVRERRDPAARPAIQEVADAGVVRFFAPLWLVKEIEAKIPVFAERRGIDAALLQRAWSEYRPQVHLFVAEGADDFGIVDPKDVPYATAQWIIGADAVVTEDPHLLESAVPTLSTRLTHKELRDWARNRAVSDSMAVAGYGSALGGVAVTGGIAKEVVKAVRARPWLGGLLAAAAAGVWWWNRKVTREKGQSPIASLLTRIGPVVNEFVDAYQEVSTRATANMTVIRDQIGHPSRTLSQWLLTACIVARRPVREEQLFEMIRSDGFRPPEEDDASRTGTIRERNAAVESKVRRDIAAILRADGRFRFTGAGWTTTLLPPSTTAVDASGPTSSAAKGKTGHSAASKTARPPKRDKPRVVRDGSGRRERVMPDRRSRQGAKSPRPKRDSNPL